MRNRPEKDEAQERSDLLSGFLIQNPNKERIMANSTHVMPGRAITVPFHGADLFVIEHNGQPYTPMRPIVEGMSLTWPSQFRKLAANKERWAISVMQTPLQGVSESETPLGGVQKMLAMPLRKLPGWLASIESGKVKNPEARDRVIQYQNECDDVLWQYWNEGLAINPRAFSVQHGQSLSVEQAETLRSLLTDRVKKLPKEQQAKAMIQGWAKLKSHFKTSYRRIPAQEFHEAVNILARHVAEWEVVDDTPTGSLEETIAQLVQQVESPNGYPAALFMPLVDAVNKRLNRRMFEVPPGKTIVDVRKLAAVWVDLGRLRDRIDGLGVAESDLPPSWWHANAISADGSAH